MFKNTTPNSCIININFLAFHTAPGYDMVQMLESTSEK